MSSQLRTIMDNIQAWTPTYDSDLYDGKCWDIDSQYRETSLPSFSAPVRLLDLPEEASHEINGLDVRGAATWIIRDTFYYKPVAHGNLREARMRIEAYIINYIDQVIANRLVANQSAIRNLRFVVRNDLAAPEDSNSVYRGVECFLEIFEKL